MIVEKKSLENGRDVKLIEQVKMETDDRFQRTWKMCTSDKRWVTDYNKQAASRLKFCTNSVRDEITYICIINRTERNEIREKENLLQKTITLEYAKLSINIFNHSFVAFIFKCIIVKNNEK